MIFSKCARGGFLLKGCFILPHVANRRTVGLLSIESQGFYLEIETALNGSVLYK